MSTLATLAVGMWGVWSLAYTAGLCGQLYCLLREDSERIERFWHAAARAHQELWILAPPGIVAGAIACWHQGLPWLLLLQAWSAMTWWQARNWPDENRWKRRGRKAKEAVTRRGARLVVVPQ